MIDLLFVLAFQAAAGQPQATTPAEPDAVIEVTQPETDPDDQIVCRNILRTGSRLPVRRCLTPGDQRQNRMDDAAHLRDTIRSTLTINANAETGVTGP